MADNDQNNDEYQFADLDSLDQESIDDVDPIPSNTSKFVGKKDVKRNALIVVAIIILLLVGYKIIGSYIYKVKPVASKPLTPVVVQEAPQQPVQVTPAPEPQSIVTEDNSQLKTQVATLELNQETLKTDVNSLKEQIGTINNNINNLNIQLANLNQVITDLSNQVAKQSEEVIILNARARPKKVRPVVLKQVERVTYYIQAVIPGRAWLIGSNGSTLTVREGTKVPGYGVIKLIDSIQGQIVTSSGLIIRFSQDDS